MEKKSKLREEVEKININDDTHGKRGKTRKKYLGKEKN